MTNRVRRAVSWIKNHGNAFRKLPPDAAGELSRLVERLAALAPERKIDWSDEDLREFRAASVRRLEESESEEAG